MKIAVTSDGPEMKSSIDERFGRATGFIVYDLETKEFNFIDNHQNINALQGAGIQAAKTVINAGATAIITGSVGPKAQAVLREAGIEIFTGSTGTVETAIGDYNAGKLQNQSETTADGRR